MMHLTNVAVQKHCEHYDEKRGGKWDLHHLKLYLMAQEDADKVESLFWAMQDVILYSLLAVQKVMIQHRSSEWRRMSWLTNCWFCDGIRFWRTLFLYLCIPTAGRNLFYEPCCGR